MLAKRGKLAAKTVLKPWVIGPSGLSRAKIGELAAKTVPKPCQL